MHNALINFEPSTFLYWEYIYMYLYVMYTTCTWIPNNQIGWIQNVSHCIFLLYHSQSNFTSAIVHLFSVHFCQNIYIFPQSILCWQIHPCFLSFVFFLTILRQHKNWIVVELQLFCYCFDSKWSVYFVRLDFSMAISIVSTEIHWENGLAMTQDVIYYFRAIPEKTFYISHQLNCTTKSQQVGFVVY